MNLERYKMTFNKSRKSMRMKKLNQELKNNKFKGLQASLKALNNLKKNL